MKQDELTLFNIQKFSTQDGPGIRSSVFLKGCPLVCQWCHNPESLSFVNQEMYDEKYCIECQNCLKGDVENCPTGARKIVGYTSTVHDVMLEIEKDQVFYEESGGGVTFSGGEPLSQAEPLLDLLKQCKAKGIHTALDTSGYAKWETMEKLLPYTDLILYDLKTLDDVAHKKYTGVSNRLILDNLRRISLAGRPFWARLPIMKGINDSEALMLETAEFLASLMPKVGMEVHLLPYHDLGVGKYTKLNFSAKLPYFVAPEKEDLSRLAAILSRFGLNVKVGGLHE